MSEDRRDNVEPIPVRMDLPREIAAFALPRREGEARIVILNANEENPRDTFVLFKLNAFAAAAIAWITTRASQWAQSHPTATATITATATSAAVLTGMNVSLDGERTPAALPQQTITIISTQPRAIVTARPTPARTTITVKPSSEAPVRASATPPPAVALTKRPEPTAKRTSKPTASNTAKPTTQPTTKQPSPSGEPTAPAQDVPPTRTLAAPDPSPESAPSTPPTGEESATTAAAARCVVNVDLDPLLDLCVLS